MDRYSHKEFWFQFIVGIHLCTALLRSHHSFSIRMGFGLCWAYSVLDFRVCLGSLSCRMTQFGPSCSYETDLTFDPIILWYRKKFPIDSVTILWLQSIPNHHSSTTVLDIWYGWFVFAKNGKTSCFVSSL